MPRPMFEDLQRFLEQLGFTTQIVPGSFVLFEHEEAQTWIKLRFYKPEDAVEPAGLVYVRHTLDAWAS